MTTKSSWPRLKPPAAGRLSNTPTTSNRSAADAHHLADRIDAGRLEQQLVRRVAEHDDVPAVLQLGAVEEPAGRASGCACRRRSSRSVPKTTSGLRLADRGRRPAAASAGRRRRPARCRRTGASSPAPRARARRRCDRFGRFSSCRDLGAVREAGDAEALDEDRVRADRADHVAQRLVEAADHRRHADDRRDADDDAEHGQPRAHLVGAHGVERHRDDFAEQPL